MTNDLLLRLAGTTATPPVPQSIAAATAAGTNAANFTDQHLDLKGPRTEDEFARSFGEGEPLMAKFLITTALAAAVANLTADFRLLAWPRNTPTTPTLVFTAANATETFTSAAHLLPNGTCVTVASATTLPAGLAASTHYYIVNRTADTFQLSLTPGGAVVAISDDGTGVHTLTYLPTVIGSSGPVPFGRLKAGNRVHVPVNPLWESPQMPRHRFLFGHILPSANLSAGAWIVDFGAAPENQVDYPSAIVT